MPLLKDECLNKRLPSTAAMLAVLCFVSRMQGKTGQQCASDCCGCSCCALFVNTPHVVAKLQGALDLHCLHGFGHVRVFLTRLRA